MATAIDAKLTSAGRAEAKPGTGFVAWTLQRVTAVLAFVFLGAHLWLTHFDDKGTITMQKVVDKVERPFFFFVDFMLLAVLVYHGLNGVRAVILDFGLGERKQKAITAVLWVIGLAGVVYGTFALAAFARDKSFF